LIAAFAAVAFTLVVLFVFLKLGVRLKEREHLSKVQNDLSKAAVIRHRLHVDTDFVQRLRQKFRR
jgi:hypothetical protein